MGASARAFEKGAVAFLLPLKGRTEEELLTVERARTTFNQKRVVIIGIGMMAIHVLSLGYFSWGVTIASAAQVAWRQHFQIIHGVWFAFSLSLVLLGRRARPPPWLGEAFALVYMLYGATVSLNTQLVGRSADVFLVVVVSLAFAFRLHARGWLVAALAGALVFFGLLDRVQPDASARTSAFANIVPVMLVASVVSRAQLGSFVREVLQARLLEELAQTLDRQLRDKLVDRSRELALAIDNMGKRVQPELAKGTVLAERFAIDRLIGQGGMGAVYRSHDRVLGRTVALKVISFAANVTALKRFLREVEIMAAVEHPAIVRSLHVDASETGVLFQVQELVDGEALDRVIARTGALSVRHIARIGSVLADALAVAHASGVVHRDVKPSNLMLTTSAPGLKLLDFGISKLAGASDATATNAVLGTPAFMAPEQRSKSDETRASADVFALGATLLALAGGKAPPELRTLIEACLSTDPVHRPPATRVREDLEKIATTLRAPALAACNEALLAKSSATAATLEAAS